MGGYTWELKLNPAFPICQFSLFCPSVKIWILIFLLLLSLQSLIACYCSKCIHWRIIESAGKENSSKTISYQNLPACWRQCIRYPRGKHSFLRCGDKEVEPITLPWAAWPGGLSHHDSNEHPISVSQNKGNTWSCSTLKPNWTQKPWKFCKMELPLSAKLEHYVTMPNTEWKLRKYCISLKRCVFSCN